MRNVADPTTYDLRKEGEGWTVYDTLTLEPARIKGVRQTGLDMEAADGLVDALNALEERRARDTSD